jgi:UTP:GlnB (protein PII) uridylyltransferase
MSHLTGDSPTPIEQLRQARAAIRAEFPEGSNDAWIDRQIDVLPSAYLNARPPEQIAEDLVLLQKLEPGELFTRGEYRQDSHTLEFSVGVRDPQPEDSLSRLSGTLSGKGIQIHSVDAYPLLDQRMVYGFLLQDQESHGTLPQARMEEVEDGLRRALTESAYRPTAARRVWRTAARKREEAMRSLPIQVRADNDTSPNYTIFDVFAPDQLALFYQVAKTLESFKLRVRLAKMSAHLDQALGVFYVTDRNDRKIEDEFQLQSIKTKLVNRLESRHEGGTKKASRSDRFIASLLKFF